MSKICKECGGLGRHLRTCSQYVYIPCQDCMDKDRVILEQARLIAELAQGCG
jgi:hypothetical protein